MFHYIKKPLSQSFPFGFVKTEIDFTVRSLEIDLGRLMLVLAVISINAYPFLALSHLTCYIEDTRIGIFWLHSAA